MNYSQPYPKSLCDGCTLNSEHVINSRGLPTNMSVKDCKFHEHNYMNFKNQIEPQYKKGYTVLNPSMLSEHIDKSFKIVTDPKSSCGGISFISDDPRLNHVLTGDLIQLDNPPLNSTVNIDEINFNKELDGYGQNYKSYSDINAGQYTYYVTKDQEDAYYEPIFSEKRETKGVLFKDPMGSLKPYYIRNSDNKCDITSNDDNVSDNYGSSFSKDTNRHRADLISRQMSKMNTQRYAPRWTNNYD